MRTHACYKPQTAALVGEVRLREKGEAAAMLHDHPWVLGRLLHAARDLLGWSQLRVAEEAGISRAALHALEVGRNPVATSTLLAVMAMLERSGVRFLPAADGLGQGVRYAPPQTDGAKTASSPGRPFITLDGGAGLRRTAEGVGHEDDRRLAAAEARTARQRRLVEQLAAAGRDVGPAHELLLHMEQALGLLRQSCSLGAGVVLDHSRDTPVRLATAT